eukprot:GEMP01064743.1.p1 GENE.GEMP01064743.1~~GEMP01064743.1.p1  ORF type:complete len:127 (+),score=23.90 GEMP01064743.1:333-713(+)
MPVAEIPVPDAGCGDPQDFTKALDCGLAYAHRAQEMAAHANAANAGFQPVLRADYGRNSIARAWIWKPQRSKHTKTLGVRNRPTTQAPLREFSVESIQILTCTLYQMVFYEEKVGSYFDAALFFCC